MALVLQGYPVSGAFNQDVLAIAADGTLVALTDGTVDWDRVAYATGRGELILTLQDAGRLQHWRMGLDGSGLAMVSDFASSTSWTLTGDANFYGTSASFKLLMVIGENLRLTTDGATSVVLQGAADFPGRTGSLTLSWPAWNPAGTRYAVAVGTFASDPPNRVYVANADGSGLTACPLTANISTLAVAWAPDGTGFYYIGSGSADRFDEEGQHIWHVTADGATTTEVWDNSPDGIDQVLRVSPDGTRVLFHAAGDIHFVNTDGSGHTNMTFGTLPQPHNESAWRLDSGQVAVASRSGGVDRVVLLDVPGGGKTMLYDGGTFDKFFSALLYYDLAAVPATPSPPYSTVLVKRVGA